MFSYRLNVKMSRYLLNINPTQRGDSRRGGAVVRNDAAGRGRVQFSAVPRVRAHIALGTALLYTTPHLFINAVFHRLLIETTSVCMFGGETYRTCSVINNCTQIEVQRTEVVNKNL